MASESQQGQGPERFWSRRPAEPLRLAVEYPGYGLHNGTPNPESIEARKRDTCKVGCYEGCWKHRAPAACLFIMEVAWRLFSRKRIGHDLTHTPVSCEEWWSMPFSHWLHFCVWAWGSKGTDRHVMAPTMDPGSWFDIAREETANSAMDFILDHLQWPVDRGHGAGCRRCHILLHLAAVDTCRLSSYLQNTRYYIHMYIYILLYMYIIIHICILYIHIYYILYIFYII